MLLEDMSAADALGQAAVAEQTLLNSYYSR
jgi:hypothetical protein